MWRALLLTAPTSLGLSLGLLLCACSALLIPDELDAEAGDVTDGAETGTLPDFGGAAPGNPLEGSPTIDCVGSNAVDSCTLVLADTGLDCELNCDLSQACPVLNIGVDLDRDQIIEPVDDETLGCILDALQAGQPRYLQWQEQGSGSNQQSLLVYRLWLLRPERAVFARWHEATIGNEIVALEQRIQASVFDDTQLVDCQDEQQGADRYTCMRQALSDAGCANFGATSCF